jgi:carbonic anhydrase/acetyltransferase-like protein (isoleucine patch superfamily)
VTIGDRTSIGDRAVVHVAKIQGDFPTYIGNQVIVGAGALVHAATLKDGCVIGESAQVMDGCVIEANAVVSPASIVTPGTIVPAAELWAGSPARKVRALTEEEIKRMPERAIEMASLAAEHALESSKDYKTILEEEELADIDQYMDDSAPRKPPVDLSDVLGQGHPGRIFRSTLSHPEEAFKQNAK